MIDKDFAVKVIARQALVEEQTKAHHAFIQAVRNKQDTMQAYFEVNKAFQALLAFDTRNN